MLWLQLFSHFRSVFMFFYQVFPFERKSGRNSQSFQHTKQLICSIFWELQNSVKLLSDQKKLHLLKSQMYPYPSDIWHRYLDNLRYPKCIAIIERKSILYFEWSPPWHVGWRLSGEGCHWEYDGKNGEFENIDFRFPWLSDTSEMGFGHDVPFLNYSDRLPHPSDLCQPDRVRWG